MKIAHVCCVAPPAGGMGTVALREVTGLRSRGHEAALFVPEGGESRSFVKQMPTAWHIGNSAWLKNIREQVQGYDVLHIHWPFFGTVDRMLLSTEGLPPIVMTFHMDAKASGLEMIPIWLERVLVQPFLFRNLKHILVSSFDYAASSSVRGLLRREPSRFIELPFGVDLEKYTPGPSVKVRFAIPEDAPVIMSLGVMDKAHAFKGVPVLLQAMAQLDVKTHAILIGDGDLRASYEEEAKRLGIERRTHFLGRVDDATVIDAYRSADVFAFPSTNRAEAFGLVALEAQTCGLPVVASDLPGLRTVVRPQETGLLVRPGSVEELAQGLYRILSDRGFRQRLSEAGIKHAQNFSWEKHLDGLQRVYKEVCGLPS